MMSLTINRPSMFIFWLTEIFNIDHMLKESIYSNLSQFEYFEMDG